jgi:hypothetical protein
MRREGIALLVTLAALVATTAGALAIARAAAATSLDRRAARDRCLADDLMGAADAAIIHWLQSRSDRVVLPSEIPTPRVEVLTTDWDDRGLDVGLDINAWDQFGMAPWGVLSRGSPVRLGLESEVLRVVDQSPGVTGLDEVAASVKSPVFPVAGEIAVGALVATHNPPQSAKRPDAAARINVNTAPPDLLEAAMRAAGDLDVQRVLARRDAGQQANAPAAEGEEAQLVPVLVARSDSWAFRVDVRVGIVRRSWWSIWVRDSSTWQLAQRILIRS